jgi:hypothetical protein
MQRVCCVMWLLCCAVCFDDYGLRVGLLATPEHLAVTSRNSTVAGGLTFKGPLVPQQLLLRFVAKP